MRHVVRRQSLELTVPTQSQAYALQEEVLRIFHARVVPGMDRVMASLVAENEVIQVDRLELDLGVLSPAHLEDDFVRRVEAELKERLAAQVGALRRGGGSTRAGGRLLTPEAATLRWLSTFLRTGGVPWWVSEASAADPEGALLALVEASPAAVAVMLRQIAGPRVARRLVKQLSPELRRRLLATLAGNRAATVEEALALWERLLAEEIPELPAAASRASPSGGKLAASFVVDRLLVHFVERFAEPVSAAAVSQLLVRAIGAERRLEPVRVVRILVPYARRRLPPGSAVRRWLEEEKADRRRSPPRHGGDEPPALGEPADAAATRRSTPDRPAQRPLPEDTAAPRPGERSPQEAPAPPEAGSVPEAAARPGVLSPDPGAQATDEGPEQESARPVAELGGLLVEDEDGWFVDDAGLVVLASFLPAYFGKLGLLEEREFRSPEDQERAVLLLRYLATGTAEAPEHFLALDKLLCGWPKDEPVVKAIEPTAEEEEESAELLSSVVRHWKALKNTSVEGLRASFLAREGRLTEGEEGWKLMVPRTGYDVLLDQLPWGVGFVLLPWMKQPLFVEW